MLWTTLPPFPRLLVQAAVTSLWVALAAPAEAQMFAPGPPAPGPKPEDSTRPSTVSDEDDFRISKTPGWGVGLIGQAGLAVLWTRDDEVAHGVLGGILRARWSYFQVGASIETTDRAEEIGLREKWIAYGGFVGAYLPYRNWIDFDFVAGLSRREYTNPDERYGDGGYSMSAPSLMLRASVSDRIGHDGVTRLGGSIVFSADLSRNQAPWEYSYNGALGSEDELAGTTQVGGISVGLALNAGFEIAPWSD